MAQVDPASLQDAWWERLLTGVLCRADAVIGVRRARRIAALWMTTIARSRVGYAEGVYRVAAAHAATKATGLWKVPRRWIELDPVVVVDRLGLTLELDLRDNLQRVLFFTGRYEPEVLRILRRELGPGSVFVDVGAHVGVHTLAVARHLERLGGGRVIAFEPMADSAGKLRWGAAANALEVEVVETALGAEPGMTDLFADERYGPHDAGVRSTRGTGEPIATASVMRFDDWARDCGLDRLDAVKIDVEGAEGDVLIGMVESLRALAPRVVVIELKHGDERAHERLSQLGYKVSASVPFGNTIYRRTHAT